MSILERALSFVSNEGEKQEESKGFSLRKILVGLFVFVVLGLFLFREWRSGKERARLLHEKAVQKEQLHQAQVDADLSIEAHHVESAQREAARISEKIQDLETRQQLAEARHQADLAAIDALRSWGDVDAFTK